jgi:hypothetical protein
MVIAKRGVSKAGTPADVSSRRRKGQMNEKKMKEKKILIIQIS